MYDKDEINIDFQDPKFVRLACYLSASGKTWRDKDTKELRTIIRGRFLSVVYPLFKELFPKSKCSILGSNKIDGAKEVRHITFRIDDTELLETLEEGGFKLGSKHRRPPKYLLNNPDLFKIYLRVLWEVHGKIYSEQPLKIGFEQKYRQELQDLANWLTFSEIFCPLVFEHGNFNLYLNNREYIKRFFDMIGWYADGEFGRQRLDRIEVIMEHSEIDPYG